MQEEVQEQEQARVQAQARGQVPVSAQAQALVDVRSNRYCLAMSLAPADIADLRARVAGPVLTPQDAGFADEVASWVRTYTHSPEVAVGATSTADVVAAVEFASSHGLPVRVQSTGHGSHAAITDGVFILTRRLDSVSIDSRRRLATLGAGVQWGAVAAAAGEHGLAPIAGSSPVVGVAGFLLGGGVGPLVRSHGFGSDYVREFELVTADGGVLVANAQQHPELFWALRGGKGGMGVVTRVTIALVDLATLYGGSLMYDSPNIEAAFRAWVDYTATADPQVSTSVAILRMPDLPFIPEPVRGRTLLSLRFVYPGDAVRGEALAAPLRAAAPVYLDGLSEMPASQIARVHGDPTDPSPGWNAGRMLTHVDQEFATTFLERVGAGAGGGGANVPFVAIELRQLGSAAARDVEGGSAVGGRNPEFTLSLIGAPNPALFEHVIPSAAASLLADIEPWLAAETTINFLGYYDPSAWPDATCKRLSAVRREVDPTTVFVYEE
jgi:FAD/FMN-containing dehydrogenase